jgi:hypothetical protein
VAKVALALAAAETNALSVQRNLVLGGHRLTILPPMTGAEDLLIVSAKIAVEVAPGSKKVAGWAHDRASLALSGAATAGAAVVTGGAKAIRARALVVHVHDAVLPHPPARHAMNPELPVQRQLDAYNARDLPRFLAEYSDDVLHFRPPAAQPVIAGKAAMAEHYATKRFNLPGLHAALVNRMVLGNKVIDHERITGIGDAPVDAAVAFEVNHQGLICRVWYFGSD